MCEIILYKYKNLSKIKYLKKVFYNKYWIFLKISKAEFKPYDTFNRQTKFKI